MEEIVEEFFERSFEDVVTEAMFERDYVFPQTKVEDYIMSIVSTPYQQFVDYVCTHYNPNPIENSEIPQISNYEACTTDVCQVLKFRDNPGMDCLEIGKALFTDDVERKEGAYFKFGENQVKGASFHGLTHCYYKKWFLTCLGYLYPELDEELRQYLAARTLLRNPFFHLIISEAKEKDVNIKKYMSGLSPSTQIRRSSSCMHFFDVILRQCQLEGVSLHSIFFDKNDASLPTNANESKSDDNTSLSDRQRNKSKNIYVLLPNGNRIMRRNAIDTFVATLQYIGLERVSTFKDRLFSGYPLVGKEERGGDYKWQKEVDGWYVYTYMSNDTKVDLLRALTDFFGLGLTVKYEDGKDVVIKENHKEPTICPSEDLSINRLCTIFFDADTTYFYFWFISILQICQKSDKNKINVETIYIRMLANAWHPIICRNLSFGYRDPLAKIVTDLQKTLRIPRESKIEDICAIIKQKKDDNNVKKCLDRITRSLPYNFLHPWIDNSLFNTEIEKRSKKHENKCLYSIHSDYWDTIYIIIDKNWRTYLRENYIPLLDFAYRELAAFMGNKNRQIYDLVALLKSNNDSTTTSQGITPLSTDKSPFYFINTNKKSYIFNSNYNVIYSCSGKIIAFNNKFYRVILSEENVVVREIKLLTNKQPVLSNCIINANWNSPLFAIFETGMNIEIIEDIRLNSADGQHDIRVSGEWYNNKGNLVTQESINNTVFPKKLAESVQTCEEQKTENTNYSDEGSPIIGRYIRLFPSHIVGKVIRVNATSNGERKIVVKTTEGKVKVIYDDPYLYEILSPSKIRMKTGTDPMYEEKIPLAKAININVKKLESIFDNKSTSYKYFWFMAIISLAKERESIVIPYKDIVIRMAAIAWPIVFEYRIDLGKSDMLSKYLEQIKQETLLKKATSSKNVETYLSRHYDSYKIRSILEPLLINVPYRFLSPWIPYTTDKEVIEKSNSGYNACLYALRDDTIILNKMWWEYIKKNYTKIRNFSERSFIVYIKSRNSHSNLAKFMSKGWNLNICDEVEDIVVSPSQLKVNDNLISGDSKDNKEETNNRKQKRDKLRIIKHPLYAVRKQALLRAMGFFRVPAKIKDVARMISRTAWGAPINEDDVEEIINTISDVEYSDGKYILRKKQ